MGQYCFVTKSHGWHIPMKATTLHIIIKIMDYAQEAISRDQFIKKCYWGVGYY